MIAIKITILVIYSIFLLIYIIHLKNQNAFQMNIEPLSHQPLFKASIIIPIVSFLTFGLISWLGHNVQLDSEGLNNFLSISKLPLALLSLAAPFAVIVNNIHRTIQMKAQIQEAKKKNSTDIYYSHQKHITELFSNIITDPFSFKIRYDDEETHEYSAKINRPIQLYRKIFSKSNVTNNNFEIDFAFKYYIKKLSTILTHHLKMLSQDSTQSLDCLFSRVESLFKLIDTADDIARYLHVDIFFRNCHHRLEGDEFAFQTMFKNEYEMQCVIFDYWEILCYVTDIIGIKNNSALLFEVLHNKDAFLEDIFQHVDFIEVEHDRHKEGFKIKSPNNVHTAQQPMSVIVNQ